MLNKKSHVDIHNTLYSDLILHRILGFYLDINLIICLLIFSFTAANPCTVYDCCLNTIKHCLPARFEREREIKLKFYLH